MSRYFKAESINPNNEFLYQAPHELMMKALEVQQKGYNETLAHAQLFENLDIKHLNDPNVKKKVQEIKASYEGKGNELVEAISADPTKWNKLSPNLRKLTAELKNDMTNGSIAAIQGTYNNWQTFLTNNKDKNTRVMQMAKQYYLNEYTKRAGETPDAYMTFDDVVNPVDLMSDKYQKILKEIKANKDVTTDGRYIYNNKSITQERAEQIAYNLLMSDPEYQAYASQQIKFGDSGFIDVDEEGNKSVKNIYGIYDNAGNQLTRDEAEKLHKDWDKLSDKEKKKTPYPFRTGLNMSHAMAGGLRALGSSYSFFEKDMTENKYGLQRDDYQYKSALSSQAHQQDVQLSGIQHSQAKELLRVKHGYDIDLKHIENGLNMDKTLMDLKIKIAGATDDEKKELTNLFNSLTAAQVAGDIYGSERLDIGTVLRNANSGDPAYVSLNANIRNTAKEKLGVTATAPDYMMYKQFDWITQNGKTKEEAIRDIVNQEVKELEKSYAGKNAYIDNAISKLTGKNITTSTNSKFTLPTREQIAELDLRKAQLTKQLTSKLNSYYDKQDELIKSKANAAQDIVYDPLNMVGSSRLTQQIKAEPSAFIVTDDKGRVVENFDTNILKTADVNITHAFGANPRSAVGMRGTVDGKVYNFVPSDVKGVQAITSKNYILHGGLKDPTNSAMSRVMNNYDYDNAGQTLYRAAPDKNGFKTITIPLSDGSGSLTIQQSPQGTVKFTNVKGADFNASPEKGKYMVAPSLVDLFGQ